MSEEKKILVLMFYKILLRILSLGKKCSVPNYKYLRQEENFTEEIHYETNKTVSQTQGC